jgi:hypothetical protein
MSNSLNNSVIKFYVNHNLINILAYLIKENSISADTVVNSIYEKYSAASCEDKERLLSLYIKYDLSSLVERILYECTDYDTIDRMCALVKESNNATINDSIDAYLSITNLSSFITEKPHIAAFIFLNVEESHFSDLDSLSISDETFLDSIVSNYNDLKHSNLLNYLIENNSTIIKNLWKKDIQFNDNQIKLLNNSTEYNYNISDTSIVDNINRHIDRYIKCVCNNIIADLYSHNRLVYSSYTAIDNCYNDSILEIFRNNYVTVTSSTYNSSLLKKINDYNLVHLFSYLKSHDTFSESELNYLIGRSDCNSNIKSLILCGYTTVEDIDRDSNYQLYLEVFKSTVYSDFVYNIINDYSYSPDEINSLEDSALDIARCVSNNDLREIFDYAINNNMYNLLSCLLYERELNETDYIEIKNLISNNNFKSALDRNIGNDKVRSSYKLLEHDCFDLFNYLLMNSLDDSDCYGFLTTDINSNYKRFRDYLISYINDNTSLIHSYTDRGVYSALIYVLFNDVVHVSESSIDICINIYSDSASNLASKFDSIYDICDNKENCISVIADVHKHKCQVYNTSAGFLNWAYDIALSNDYSTDQLIKAADYCYNGTVSDYDGNIINDYTDSFIYKLCDNTTSIGVHGSGMTYSIPFGVNNYADLNFSESIYADIDWDDLVSANSYSIISFKIMNSYVSVDSNVRTYIINNWKKLIPYITEGYTRGCKPLTNVTYDYDLFLSADNFVRQVGHSTNQSTYSNILNSNYHPITVCYMQYTKHIIASNISNISESDLV